MQEKLHMTQHPGTDPPPFTTTITDVNEDSVFLEETFCYPRGGGQQGDTGTISNSRIQAKLLETLPGESIFHPLSLVDGFKVGDEVKCIIDQKRRNKNNKN